MGVRLALGLPSGFWFFRTLFCLPNALPIWHICTLDPMLTYASPRFDSSIGRGAFVTEIGIGRVIKGMPSLPPFHRAPRYTFE